MSHRAQRLRGVWWLPSVLGVLGAVEMLVLRPERWGAGIALELAACLALVGRRRYPLLAPLSALVLMVLMPVLATQLGSAAMPIAIIALAFFSLGRRVPGLPAYVGFAAVLVGVWADYQWFDDRTRDITDVVFVVVIAAPPFALGRLVGRLAAQKQALEEAQEQIRLAAARGERERIARELHDVIAHSVSAMVVQTAAAQDLVHTNPDRAAAVLADLADAGRRALAETGRLLHVIRDDDDELGLAPAPGLAQVPALVEQFRSDGLRVELTMTDPVPDLPAGVDVSAYRIVQEALTNALRYGTDRHASLSVLTGADGLSIRASNLSNGSSSGSGLGLIGISERVQILGGTLAHGLEPDGRFVLLAMLPVTR